MGGEDLTVNIFLLIIFLIRQTRWTINTNLHRKPVKSILDDVKHRAMADTSRL
jgi:hypothetical protein